MLKNHKAVDITYSKPVGGSGELRRFERTDRTIIPTQLPSNNFKALDVSELNEAEISDMERQLTEYASYYDAIVNTIFSFEDWLSITYGDDADTKVKWRTFDKNGIVNR